MEDPSASLEQLRADLDDVCVEVMDAPFAQEFAALALPAVRMRAATRGATSIGLAPHTAPHAGWPMGADGSPLTHLCSIDLADLASFETGIELPSTGILQAFYDVDPEPYMLGPTEFDSFALAIADASVIAGPGAGVELTQVLTIPSGHEPAVTAFAPRENATEFNRRGRNRAELRARTRGESSVEIPKPSTRARFFEQVNDVNEKWDGRIESLVGSGPKHQIGGWPASVQNAIWAECDEGATAAEELLCGEAPELGANPAERWSLVMQVDTDEEKGWMWGDGGTLYFAARTPIKREQLWIGSWCVAQSY